MDPPVYGSNASEICDFNEVVKPLIQLIHIFEEMSAHDGAVSGFCTGSALYQFQEAVHCELLDVLKFCIPSFERGISFKLAHLQRNFLPATLSTFILQYMELTRSSLVSLKRDSPLLDSFFSSSLYHELCCINNETCEHPELAGVNLQVKNYRSALLKNLLNVEILPPETCNDKARRPDTTARGSKPAVSDGTDGFTELSSIHQGKRLLQGHSGDIETVLKGNGRPVEDNSRRERLIWTLSGEDAALGPPLHKFVVWHGNALEGGSVQSSEYPTQNKTAHDRLKYSREESVCDYQKGNFYATKSIVSHSRKRGLDDNGQLESHQSALNMAINTEDESPFLNGSEVLRKRRIAGCPEADAVAEAIERDSFDRKAPSWAGTRRSEDPRKASSGVDLMVGSVRKGTETNSLMNDDIEYYKELLQGGDIRDDIIAWVLSMKLKSCDMIQEDDISGLNEVKKLIRGKLINPILRPDLHVGLHQAPRGILLFGPPGTGKTTLAKWIANAAKATFFEVSPSSIISKFQGETETLVRALFKVAELSSPSIIFIDEIDSLLGKRRDKEEDSTIRMKNQLLQMMDGLSSNSGKMVVLIGATNRPDMLDEAALRRLSKRVLVPLPDLEARKGQIRRLLSQNSRNTQSIGLKPEELLDLAEKTQLWNGSDLRNLCSKAAEYSYYETINVYGGIENIPGPSAFREINHSDLLAALQEVHPSSSDGALDFEGWAKRFGTL